MAKKTTQGESHGISLTMIGIGIASVAASTYFLLGPKAKQHQRHLKAWAIKMKGDVIEKLETARDVTEPVYHRIVDSVASEYAKNVKASKEEVAELASDLKKHWKTLSKAPGLMKKSAIKMVTSAKKK